ncbi:MAG: hypothetical protein SGJ19_15535 [Planctomycetia bacterium]|nr:hypothetical protein [Planctomycetia bacterium]
MRRAILVLLSVLCLDFTHSTVGAEVVIDADTTIDSRYEDSSLRVIAGLVPQTTVHFVDPAYVEESVYLEDDSDLEMSGGEIHDSLYLSESTVANLTGGTIGDTVHVDNFSVITLNGANLLDYVYNDGFSLATYVDGNVRGAVARGGSLVSIIGGNFQANGQESILVAEDNAKIYVYGTEFNQGFGVIRGEQTGTLTGVLKQGMAINGTFTVHGNGEIILRQVPEPATLALFLPGMLMLAWPRKRCSA